MYWGSLLLTGAIALSASVPSQATSQEGFAQCVERFSQEAKAQGLNSPVVRDSLANLKWVERVIELDRRQPEFTTPFSDYLSRRVTDQRVADGRRLLREHRDLLARVEREYGVPAPYLVAFWGLETNFGRYFGKMSVLDSLATLACDERRSTYFTRELMSALRIVDEGAIAPERMEGSWAGAMGHVQFMPSVFIRHAVDYDNDGKRDLWNSLPDAMASAANFLSSMGWDDEYRWGREVRLPENFPYLEAGLKQRRPLSEWHAMGVRQSNGDPLPSADIEAALLVPSGHRGPAFLVYDNFKVIMGWNQSEYYALAVGHMADRIAGAGKLNKAPPEDSPRLNRDQVMAIQEKLNDDGHAAGKVDGIWGPTTRQALSRFQSERNLVPDGFPDPDTLKALGVTR
ncbi:lytic murein transglycosylase [Marinimicrobium sp. C6131]|uniref:lytic murein transglycosylase n=1 Tax=Marinimicrobium sp. C6131 TaxID=3022676 RepID=UPI00223D4DF7|nr:lytic murein transglycosylase [Marinimicrobium sp. C6131]UZJ46038.1 lytic murein transglycosylase [Marinimicrobium sp. C6131]